VLPAPPAVGYAPRRPVLRTVKECRPNPAAAGFRLTRRRCAARTPRPPHPCRCGVPGRRPRIVRARGTKSGMFAAAIANAVKKAYYNSIAAF